MINLSGLNRAAVRGGAAVTLILLGAALLAGGMPRSASADPAPTRSRYVTSHIGTDFYNWGKARGIEGQSGAAILAFGDPGYVYPTGFGADLSAQKGFATLAEIEANAKQFASGYAGYAPSGVFLTVVLGVTNSGPNITASHGAAWAQMVTNVQNYLVAAGFSGKVGAVAGYDAELAWSSPAVARTWAQGYDSADTRVLYVFGDAAGCPTAGGISAVPGDACAPGVGLPTWSQEDLWYLTWGLSPSWPLPQIYRDHGTDWTDVQARQWQRLSYYSYVNHGGKILIAGSLTQNQACLYNIAYQFGTCPTTNNTPSAGWIDLWNALQYLNTPFTAWDPAWATDMSWDDVVR